MLQCANDHSLVDCYPKLVNTTMPITTSAKKALRGSLRKKASNDRMTKLVKESIKAVEKTAKTSKTEAAKLVSKAQSMIDKAAKKGILKKNTASRRKSKVARTVK